MSDPVSVVLMEVVCVSFDRGSVAAGDARPVSQYWSKDGRLLAEFDHRFSAPDAAGYEGQLIWPELATDTSPATQPDHLAPAEQGVVNA
jgi:hypothetical protein